MDGYRFRSQACCPTVVLVWKRCTGWCFVNGPLLSYIYLVCILFAMPSLHLFTFVIFPVTLGFQLTCDFSMIAAQEGLGSYPEAMYTSSFRCVERRTHFCQEALLALGESWRRCVFRLPWFGIKMWLCISMSVTWYYMSITIVQSYTGKYQEFVAVCIVTSAQHK